MFVVNFKVNNIMHVIKSVPPWYNWNNVEIVVKHTHTGNVKLAVKYILNQLRWEVIVRFVDISRIFDHHCLNYLFIVKTINTCTLSWSSRCFCVDIHITTGLSFKLIKTAVRVFTVYISYDVFIGYTLNP
jgi:hypothetical protein